MTCADVRESAAAYVLNALEPGEARELEAHVLGPGPHAGCREALERARSTTLALAGAVAAAEVRPSPGLWPAIEARTGQAPPRTAAPTRRRAAWAGALAAATALVIAVLLGRALQQERAAARLAAQERDLARAQVGALQGEQALQAEALALLGRPGSRIVPLEPQPGQTGRAVAILDVGAGRALVASSSLPPQPGKDYQLWVIRGTAPPQPAGFLRTTGRTAAGEVDPALLQGPLPDALAVSLEPAGGSPAPTQVLLVGKVTG